MRKTIMFLSGLFAGVLVGGVAALLLAPYSGGELRERAQEGLDSLIEEGKKAAAARRLELEKQLEGFKRGTPVTIEIKAEDSAG